MITTTRGFLLLIMQHFEIPPGTILTGEIPGELEYGLWADDNDTLHIYKTCHIAAEPYNPNMIGIKMGQAADDWD